MGRVPAAVFVVLVALLVPRATSAAEQEPGAAVPNRVEIGGSAGAIIFLPTFGASAALPVGRHTALEGVADFVPITFDERRAAHFLFQGQLRHRVRPGRHWDLHVTGGVTLAAMYTRSPEQRQPRPDGSVLVVPRYRRFRLEEPALLHGGIGGRRAVTPRVVVRWDVQALVLVAGPPIPVPRTTFTVSWR